MGKTPPVEDFTTRLQQYQRLIDTDIDTYVAEIAQATRLDYGAQAHHPVAAYLQILKRGGKRVRGALTMLGYEMSGGNNQPMSIEAARAIEMFHAHMLVIDDIQDRSATRRGGPTAHKLLEAHHLTSKFIGDSEHFGRATAINGALSGLHAAEIILTRLDAPAEVRLRALELINKTLLVTIHGQSHDITNGLLSDVEISDVERVMEWKTATYTILNPLQVGMALAGADQENLEAIVTYALHVGKAFQITDDVIGTFGEEAETHKNPMDDIREGKRTMLVVHALKHARLADRKFLRSCLGNELLAIEDFERCKMIMQRAGSVEYVRARALQHVDHAILALDKEAHRWTPAGVSFLRGLAVYIFDRSS